MHNRASLGLALAIMAVSAYGIITALAWPLKAKLFPLVISIPLFMLAAAEAVWVLFDRPARPPAEPASADAMRRTLVATGWAVGFFAAIVLLGFTVAVPLLLLIYLRFQGRESWLFTIAFTAVVSGSFYGLFDLLLHLPFPAGWLFSALGLAG